MGESTGVAWFGFDDLEAPTAPKHERAVHVKDFARPERGLVAANTHAHLKHETRDPRFVASDERLHDLLRKRAGLGFERRTLGAGDCGHFRIARRHQLSDAREFARATAQFNQRLERASEQGAAAGKLHRLSMIRSDLDVFELRGDTVVLRGLRGEDATKVLREKRCLDGLGIGGVAGHGWSLSETEDRKKQPPHESGAVGCCVSFGALRALLLLGLEVLAGELLLEPLDAAESVDEGLLSGEERVRARPDFDIHLRNSRADGHDDLAAEDDLALREVLGVNFALHVRSFVASIACWPL